MENYEDRIDNFLTRMLWFLSRNKNGGNFMFRKKVSVVLVITMLGCSVFGGRPVETNAANYNLSYSIQNLLKKLKEKAESFQSQNHSTSQSVSTEALTTELFTTEELTTELLTTEEVIYTETPTIESSTTEEVVYTEAPTIELSTTEEVDYTEELTTELSTTEETLSTEELTTEITTTEVAFSEEELTTETSTTEELTSQEITESEATSEQDIIAGESSLQTPVEQEEIYEKISHYKEMADAEANWLWSQQLSNGAFAFYNSDNGKVYINPYFSEIVAIALINHDSSPEAKTKMEHYFDWHFSHINTAETDYNGLAGTIYDYNVMVENGVVVSETSKGSYDSTDSYSALFIKALADYEKTYGDKEYLLAHESQIKDITNVMFATMSGGYTYAKPDYKIMYLMDNAEVYAGLKAAEYIYSNVIDDAEMYEKVSNALAFYDEHFNEHWWKGDHYATVLNPDYSEYTGYEFSWDAFYPCATAQMFPILYGIIDADSTYAQEVYKGICGAWDWQEMDYVSENASVFCWGNFAYLGGLMKDEEKLDSYMNKYQDIVDSGRPYPLYSSESAMALLGCDEMIIQLETQLK